MFFGVGGQQAGVAAVKLLESFFVEPDVVLLAGEVRNDLRPGLFQLPVLQQAVPPLKPFLQVALHRQGWFRLAVDGDAVVFQVTVVHPHETFHFLRGVLDVGGLAQIADGAHLQIFSLGGQILLREAAAAPEQSRPVLSAADAHLPVLPKGKDGEKGTGRPRRPLEQLRHHVVDGVPVQPVGGLHVLAPVPHHHQTGAVIPGRVQRQPKLPDACGDGRTVRGDVLVEQLLPELVTQVVAVLLHQTAGRLGRLQGLPFLNGGGQN